MPDQNANLTAALYYAETLNWKVFPLQHKSKRPLPGSHGFHDATSDLDKIRRWWNNHPELGIGVATGMESGIIVLDVDPRNGGDQSLVSIEDEFGAIPRCPLSMTGGGGKHFVFKHPGKKIYPSVKGLYPGIDVKSDGGYIAAPFSVHPSGSRYEWKSGQTPYKVKPARTPKWLFALMKERREDLIKVQKDRAIAGPDEDRTIPEGERDDTITSVIGTMQRRGMSYTAILAAAMAENAARCTPPMPESQVQKIVNSVTRYAPDEGAAIGVTRDAASGELIKFQDVLKMGSEDPPEISWVLPDLIAEQDCSLLVGPPYTGKSWLTLDMAIAGATGRPIFGHYKPSKPLKVLLIDEESQPYEQHRRVRHLVRAWGLDPQEMAGRVYMTTPSQGFSFRSRDWRAAIHQRVKEIQPDLIILDSITAIASIQDEAKAVDVRRFFHDELYPLRAYNGAAILMVHHTNKAVYQKEAQVSPAGMIRGSIDWLGAPDSVLLLLQAEQGTKTLTLNCVKARHGEAPEPVFLQIVEGTEGGVRPLVRAPRGPGKGRPRKALPARLEDAKAAILSTLGDSGSMPTSQLVMWARAEHPDLEPEEIRASLKRMTGEGLLVTEPDPDDKRSYIYSLPNTYANDE